MVREDFFEVMSQFLAEIESECLRFLSLAFVVRRQVIGPSSTSHFEDQRLSSQSIQQDLKNRLGPTGIVV